MFNAKERAAAMGVFAIAPFLGPAIGPVVCPVSSHYRTEAETSGWWFPVRCIHLEMGSSPPRVFLCYTHRHRRPLAARDVRASSPSPSRYRTQQGLRQGLPVQSGRGAADGDQGALQEAIDGAVEAAFHGTSCRSDGALVSVSSLLAINQADFASVSVVYAILYVSNYRGILLDLD